VRKVYGVGQSTAAEPKVLLVVGNNAIRVSTPGYQYANVNPEEARHLARSLYAAARELEKGPKP
jgi:hypothetical protein